MSRFVDVVVSVILVIVLLPIGCAIAVLILLADGWPIFYLGRRAGRGFTTFAMLKFRTMKQGQGALVTSEGDPRITATGRFLRNNKLDELPQLINVIVGHMSLVGPRPEDPSYVNLFADAYREILRVRPGITGPTQLAFRHEARMLPLDHLETVYTTEVLPKKIESDLSYVRSQSPRGDFEILVATLRRLLMHR